MAEIYVTSTADSGAGSLRQAIADAQNGDVILFDADVFPAGQTTSILLSAQLAPQKNVTICGGFNDGDGGYTSGATKRFYVYRDIDDVKTKVYIDDDNPAQEGETILFENVCRVALDGQETVRCVYNSAADINWLGVCFINGNSDNYGGAANNFNTTVNTFNDCAFIDNAASTYGGALYASYTTQNTLNGCNLTACNAGAGGAIYSTSKSVNMLNDCIIDNCVSSSSNGGGVYSAQTSQNILNNCVIDGCSATTYGGGVYSYNSSQNTLNNCTISGCNAIYGGGVYSHVSSQNTLNNCVFDGCTATNGGGGVYSRDASQNTLNDCVFDSCSATNGGAAYCGDTSQNTFDNCRSTNITATNGKFIYASSSSVVYIKHCEQTESVNFGQTTTLFISSSSLSNGSIGATATLNVEGGVVVFDVLGLASGATITIADGAALTITKSATIGAATFTSAGRGYLATAAGIDISSATLTNVVLCAYGAGLESFSARETTRTEIKLDWTQTDTTIPVLIEQKVGDSWETVVESTAGTYNVTVEPATRHLFRAFDGVSFHVDAAWHGIEAPQFKVVGIIVEADAQDVNWQAITEVVNVDGAVRSGQSITILARIYDAYDNETVLLNETGNIVSVVYTLEKRSKSLFDYTWTPVEGHDEVEVSSECVLEDLQTSDAWTVDEVGYSFVLTPDTTEHTLFATPGVYRFRVKITLAEGNPVVFYEEINVVDE